MPKFASLAVASYVVSVSVYRHVVDPVDVSACRVYVSAGSTQFAVRSGSPDRVRVTVDGDTQYDVIVEWSTGPPLPRWVVSSSGSPASWFRSSWDPPAE